MKVRVTRSSVSVTVQAHGTMAAQAKKQIGALFRKNLLDLVKGLRSQKANESEYINQCLSEIKEEVKSIDKQTKAMAISKLTYLYMLGYDISFAHFNVVEVMSQPCFSHRRIAYLAASLSFTVDTDVILLTVHLFKKRFNNVSSGSSQDAATNVALQEGSMYESGCAVNCLANICTPYLAQSLLEDICTMMSSSKPYLRKKSVLVLYAVYRKYTPALRFTFDRLKDKLRDEDSGVQNAAVNVICELARKNPSNYISLLPALFELLNNSNNNWMLIKLVKLLGSLIPAEPRLGKKLQEPLTHIITNTPAKSLLYECINTVCVCQHMSRAMVRLCLDKLRTFVEDPDQNLKYLGLLGLNKIMGKNVKAVAQHKDLILQCLDDTDVTIRMRALDLITSMVNEKNLDVIIQKLTDHLYGTDGSYRDHVLEQIILVCKKHDYEFVRDFAWYVQLLTNMTQLSSMCKSNAVLVSSQLMDVAIRVPEVREFSVQQMEGIIVNNDLISDAHNMQSNAICRILEASAYIVGEYSQFVAQHLPLVSAMLQARVSSLPSDIQCIFIHNALKVVCAGLVHLTTTTTDHDETASDTDALLARTISLLEPFSTSSFIEVQERANAYLFFMQWLDSEYRRDPPQLRSLALSLQALFASELMPLHPNSQQVIADKLPAGLDLEAWIFEAPPDDSEDDDGDADSLLDISDQEAEDWFSDKDADVDGGGGGGGSKRQLSARQKDLLEQQARARKQRQTAPWYIGDDGDANGDGDDDVGESMDAAGKRRSKRRKERKQKRRRGSEKDALSAIDIESVETKKIDDELGIEVYPKGVALKKVDKKALPKNVTYTVNKSYGDPMSMTKKRVGGKKQRSGGGGGKKHGKEETTTKTMDENAFVNPLSLDIDLNKPIDEEMPTIKPYKQDEIVYKETTEQPPQQQPPSSDNKKKEAKRKSKKERKKEKKEQEKEKKRVKKENRKLKKEQRNKEQPPKQSDDDDDHAQNIPEPAGHDGDLLGFLHGDNGNQTTQAQPTNSSDPLAFMDDDASSKPTSKVAGDDFLNGLLNIDDTNNTATHGIDDGDTHDKNNNKHKKKKNKKKNGVIPPDQQQHSTELTSTQILFEDDTIRVCYFALPSHKKPATILDLHLTTTNVSSSGTTVKSIKLSLSKSPAFKPKDKDKTSFSLAKNLEAHCEHSTVVKLKCVTFEGGSNHDCAQCKISYNGIKAKALTLCFGTHCFVTNESVHDEVPDMEALMAVVEDKEKCACSGTRRVKIAPSKSIADALDTLVKVWRVHNISTTKTKATYFGKLMHDGCLAIYVKLNAKKNAIEISVHSAQQTFVDGVLEEFARMIAPN